MIPKIRTLLKGTTGRYFLVGISVYIIELVTIVSAQRLGASNTFAVGISFWLGLVLSFLLQKLYTFKDTRMHHKIVLVQIIAATSLVLFNFGFTLFVTQQLQNTFPTVVTRTIALGITTIWNFYLYRTKIFKNTSLPLVD